jgi:hypothetical protein
MEIFAPLKEGCYFHFIDAEQPTAKSDKPEWFFKYLFEVLEANITKLIEYKELSYRTFSMSNIALEKLHW